jgi:hypothetical protein
MTELMCVAEDPVLPASTSPLTTSACFPATRCFNPPDRLDLSLPMEFLVSLELPAVKPTFLGPSGRFRGPSSFAHSTDFSASSSLTRTPAIDLRSGFAVPFTESARFEISGSRATDNNIPMLVELMPLYLILVMCSIGVVILVVGLVALWLIRRANRTFRDYTLSSSTGGWRRPGDQAPGDPGRISRSISGRFLTFPDDPHPRFQVHDVGEAGTAIPAPRPW